MFKNFKLHCGLFGKSILFCALMIFSVAAYAFATPDQIYELAQAGDIKSLTKLTDVIDTMDKNENTALCQAVYSHDYSAFHLLRTMGANPRQRCIQRLTHQEMQAFNAGYKSWFHQVKQGNIQPNWMKKQDSSAWLSSFKGYALEIGLVGIAAGAIAAKGGGGSSSSSSNSKSENNSVDCNGHGTKKNGACTCTDNYYGTTCENAPLSCGEHGSWNTSNHVCDCTGGYTGTTCETEPSADACASVNCGSHGTCSAGVCTCTDDYYGTNCENAPLSCGEHGSWNTSNHVCDCTGGYTGTTCETEPSADACASVNCGSHGTCSGGVCTCADNYYGTNCENAPLSCGSHGSWNTTNHVCDCTGGYTGTTCETEPSADACASVNCGSHGTCSGGVCTCTDNYYGTTCENAPVSCTHGSWNTTNHECDCDEGYAGTACDYDEASCNYHGIHYDEGCECYDGYLGDTCQIEAIVNCKTQEGTTCTQCNQGYSLEDNVCVLLDFDNLDKHPGSTKTATEYAAETEFTKGNFLNQINAQYAYERGYNGFITTTAADETVSLTDNKIKVGVIDNYLDVSNPDLTANIKTATVNKTTQAAGINFDYGPCRLHSGVRDTTHCYGIKVRGTDGSTEYGDLVLYKTGKDDYDVIYEGNDDDGWYTQNDIDNSLFLDYGLDYDWDSDSKYNVKTTKNTEFNSQTNTSNEDHGTHVSGIIAALANSVGMQGVVPNAEILFTQAYSVVSGDAFKGKWFESAMQNYADSGVKVVNMSIGNTENNLASNALAKEATSVFSKYEVEGMKIAAENGIVTVHSAGNGGNNKEALIDAAYPLTTTFNASSSYDLTKLNISVVAVDKNDKLASYSQVCGSTKGFCLSAPGGDLDRGITLFQQSSEYITRSNALDEQESALETYYAAYENATTDEERIAAGTEYNNHVSQYNTAVDEFNTWVSGERQKIYADWGIYSTVKTDGSHTKESDGSAYGYMQGTSMAAPVVTGSVALLMSAYPYLSSQQVVEILFRSANKDLVGWGTSLTNEVVEEGQDPITITDTLSTWTDSFGNSYDISSIYGHGEVDLQAATQPLGTVNVPVQGTQNKQSVVNTKLALPLVLNAKITASIPKTVMGLDDYNRPFTQSISGLVYRAKHNSDSFKRDFRSFVNPKQISTAGVQDKLSFKFSSSQTNQNLLGMGALDMMYQFNDSNKMKFSYRSDVLAEKTLSEKITANPFVDMTDSYALGHEFKLNSKLGFGFSAMTGKNGFYETDEDLDDEFKKSMQAFDMSVVYKPVSQVSFRAVGGLLKEKESVLGMNGSGLFETENSSTYYTGAVLEYSPAIPFTLSAAYYYGQSKMPKTSGLVQFDDIVSDSFAFEAKYQPDETNVLGFQFMSPLRIRKGSAIFNMPVARDLYSDTVYYDKTKVSLKPNARELDLGMYYLSQTEELDWRTELMMRLHPDHVSEAKPDYRALFGLSWKY